MLHRALSTALLLLTACRSDAPRSALTAADTVDGCRQTSGVRPDTSITIGSDAADRWRRELARGAEYRCVITPKTEMRFVVAGDTTIPSLDSLIVYGSASDARPLQVLKVESADIPQPYIPNLLRAIDLDADGHRDLMMGTSWGATGNTSYAVWRFDPRAGRFVEDSLLSMEFNPEPVPGRPCVRTFGNSSARDDESGLYCLHDGRWALDSAERHEWDRKANSVIHSVLARRGDSLVVVKRETVRDTT
jgi:hypothetical protein